MIIAVALALFATAHVRPAHSYAYQGVFLEGCSCLDTCVSEITGKDAGCHGMGAIEFKKASFDGADFSGTRVAFVWDSDKWVRIYVDAPDAKRKAAADFMTTMLKDWGALESVSSAKIALSRSHDNWTFSVNDGAIATMEMKPVFGGDGKTAVEHTNLSSPLHSKLSQAATVNASFNDGHTFQLQGTNAFFNGSCAMKGSI